jgi:oligopeptide/dipeptide ABC transporter ATP-binding protein
MTGEPLLRVHALVKQYRPRSLLGRGRVVHALNEVSLSIAPGETLGLVGESGCGKSTLGRLVVALERPTSGEVTFRGESVFSARGPQRRQLRRRLQIVFQDPYTTLNPRLPVGVSVAEGLEIHRLVPRAGLAERTAALFREVGLDPDDAGRYPHEFSGGQRQRLGIARALAVEPELLVCDEPVSALDVSVRAQVVSLLRDLQAGRGLSYLFIAHDLSVVAQLAQRIAVLYFGMLMEVGLASQIVAAPLHPYTRALLSAVPVPDPARRRSRIVLPGEPPNPTRLPIGCPFADRCFHPAKDQRCLDERPLLRPVGGREVACHYAELDSTRRAS